MTLARRGRACQRASTFTVAATLRLAPSWSRRHPKARRKTHPLNFRSTQYWWPTSSVGRENATVPWYRTDYASVPWEFLVPRKRRMNEVAGRSFDVSDWFSYLASATPYRDTHARVKSKPRWRLLKEIFRYPLTAFEGIRQSFEPKFDRVLKDVNRSWHEK